MTKLLLCLCGISASLILGTIARVGIIDGEIVRSNLRRFSYQVTIPTHTRTDQSLCGGGILNDKYILTAAHCVLNKDLSHGLLVIAGTADLNDETSVEKVRVKKVFWPTSYDDQQFKGDIAVLMLNHSLRLPHHRDWKLHLPLNNRETYVNVIAEIAGFGTNQLDEHHPGAFDFKLRFAQAKVIRMEGVTGIPDDILFAQVISHGRSRPRGVASGDSGSPLVYNKTVIGILSAGIQDRIETLTSPGVYIRVSHHLDFIRKAMRNIETADMATIEFVV